MPFSAFCAKTPVSSAPTVPPTPCAATTSSESSSDDLARHCSVSQLGTAAMPPRAIALIGPMNPAAGVTATRPTTMAVAAPTAVGLPDLNPSRKVHTNSVAAGASIVVTNASPAMPLADSALPALKPNQPNQSRPAPSSVNGTLCGSSDVDGYSVRLPTTIA